ncbi:MAG: glycosyltransferase family 4 protein [Flavobacterium sp.]|nr:glycosyltransferase family 4 protein [Flavobacterium sp.]
MKKKIIRTATVAMSLDILLKGQLAYLNKQYEIVALSGQDQYLQNVAKREQVKTIAITITRPIAPIQDLVALIKLYRTFKSEKPLIVHSITPKAGLLSMIAGYFAKVPIRIHVFTGLVFPTRTGFIQQLLIFLDKILCRFATNVYPEGQGVKNDLIAYKITKKPLKIIANGNVNGIDIAYFNPNLFTENDNSAIRNKLQIKENDFVFIFVGRLVKDKGINELSQAFVKLQSTNKNVKLLLVGNFENDLDPLLPETYVILENNKSIISVGFQVDVRPYFAIANALVFPSYREGFPNVVLQAGAMSLPSIVTNINGCNEIITNQQNGLIIQPKNVQQLVEAMTKLLNEPNLVNALKNNSRINIIKKFDQNLVWKAILEEYKLLENQKELI